MWFQTDQTLQIALKVGVPLVTVAGFFAGLQLRGKMNDKAIKDLIHSVKEMGEALHSQDKSITAHTTQLEAMGEDIRELQRDSKRQAGDISYIEGTQGTRRRKGDRTDD